MPTLVAICLILLAIANIVQTDIYLKKRTMQPIKGLISLSACGILASLFMAGVLLVRDETAAFVLYTLFFMAMGWVCFSCLSLCTSLSDRKMPHHRQDPSFYIYCVATLCLIANFIYWKMTGNTFMFSVIQDKFYDSQFWMVNQQIPFFVYSAIGLLTMGLSIASMIGQTAMTASIYHFRYIFMAVLFAVATVCYFLGIFGYIHLFMSAGSVSIGLFMADFCILYYTPQKCINNALQMVTDSFNDGLVLYDNKHTLLYVSDSFTSSMQLKDTAPLEEEKQYWEDLREKCSYPMSNGLPVYRIVRGGADVFYELNHLELADHFIPVGTVYWLHNVTGTLRNLEKMRRQAHFDPLTGIYNEHYFEEQAAKMLHEYPEEKFLLMSSDIAKFTVFMANYGQEKADEFLRLTADHFDLSLGNVPMCVYGRTGPDNFSILLRASDFYEEKLENGISDLIARFDVKNYKLHIALGIYAIEDIELPVRDMILRSLMAAGTAKRDTSRRVAYFDEKIQKKFMQEQRYESELSDAIEDGQIRMFLQPQMDNEGRAMGAEALVRWIHPEDGLVPPGYFIPAFEQSGRITEMDLYVWKKACERLRIWKDQGREDLYISINISAKDLYALDVADTFLQLVDEYEINPGNLKLEITESSIINNLNQQLPVIQKLQESGFEVEMDDFGSAYSSFNMLKDICVDVLKIDMKFLGSTENIERSESILRSIIGLSKELNMRTVAEGVETEGQLEFLRAAGCDVYQGYFYSKPIPEEEFCSKYVGRMDA